MKKSNLITLMSFVLLIAIAVLAMIFWRSPSENPPTDALSTVSQQTSSVIMPESENRSTTQKESPQESTSSHSDETKPNETDTSSLKKVSMDDALFIGDSRTVGLCEYGEIPGADFFADVGMNVFNIYKKTVSVPTVGKVTLTQLLTNKKYGKIYIMLGINEIGYPFDSLIAKYKELLDFVSEKQPGAEIFIQANLHVTKARSDKDKVINNPAINKLNEKLKTFADGKHIYYLDANTLFDDANGNLSADKTVDSAHPYGKYYMQWGKWIINQTALVEEG